MRLPWKQAEVAEEPSGLDGVRLPEPPWPLELELHNGERFPGRLAERDGDELVVVMMVPVLGDLSEAQLRDTVIEINDGGGILRLIGDAYAEEDDMLRFGNVHSLDALQRREYVRVKTTRPVQVKLAGHLAPMDGCSVDLSGGGMLLSGFEHLRIGANVEFSLTTHDDGTAIMGVATVVRNDSRGRCAVAFRSITEGDRRRLIRFLFERQREELRKGLLAEDDYA